MSGWHEKGAAGEKGDLVKKEITLGEICRTYVSALNRVFHPDVMLIFVLLYSSESTRYKNEFLPP